MDLFILDENTPSVFNDLLNSDNKFQLCFLFIIIVLIPFIYSFTLHCSLLMSSNETLAQHRPSPPFFPKGTLWWQLSKVTSKSRPTEWKLTLGLELSLQVLFRASLICGHHSYIHHNFVQKDAHYLLKELRIIVAYHLVYMKLQH